jgi:hypothetical protein
VSKRSQILDTFRLHPRSVLTCHDLVS